MNIAIHEFNLGNFRCWAINDMPDGEASPKQVFPNATDEEIEIAGKRFGFTPDGKIPQSSTVLLIDTGKARVLVDTGSGVDTGGEGQLFSQLETLGIARESIDIVVLSHIHSDHFGGILNGEGRLNFPNAKHYIWREEWDFYCNPERMAQDEKDAPQRFAYRQKFLLPIAPHWHFLDEANTQVMEGISLIPSKGHTAHHCAIRLESTGEILFFTADAFIHPAYIENPDWTYTSDFDSAATVASRKVLVERIAIEKALALGYHFPFPCLGRVVADGEGYCWEA